MMLFQNIKVHALRDFAVIYSTTTSILFVLYFDNDEGKSMLVHICVYIGKYEKDFKCSSAFLVYCKYY